MASITIRNLVKRYGDYPVIPDLNLDIADHEFVVFVGPSGCGKSTLLNIGSGLAALHFRGRWQAVAYGGALLGLAAIVAARVVYAYVSFPSDRTPQGAYLRVAIAVNRAGVRVLSIVRQKRNVRDVRKRSYVPQVAIASCLFIGRSQRDKRPARWQARQLTSTRNELVTRSKRCSPN